MNYYEYTRQITAQENGIVKADSIELAIKEANKNNLVAVTKRETTDINQESTLIVKQMTEAEVNEAISYDTSLVEIRITQEDKARLVDFGIKQGINPDDLKSMVHVLLDQIINEPVVEPEEEEE